MLKKRDGEQPQVAEVIIIADNMMNIYSAKDETARSLIMNDIAPHFEEVKIVYVEDEIDVVKYAASKDRFKRKAMDISAGAVGRG